MSDSKTHSIYKITCGCGCLKHYIGMTGSSLRHRILLHRCQARTSPKCSLHNHFNETGSVEDFTYELIEECANKALAKRRENYYITTTRAILDGFNIRNGSWICIHDIDRRMCEVCSPGLNRCIPCDKKFCSGEGYRKHLITRGHLIKVGQYTGPDFKCETCVKGFTSASFLRRHLTSMTHHLKATRSNEPVARVHHTFYECKVCDRKFVGNKVLQTHLRSAIHKNKVAGTFYNHTCELCDRVMSTKQALENHRRSRPHLRRLDVEPVGLHMLGL